MSQRGRRATRLLGDARRAAILSSAESLLADRPLEGISIAEIAAGAGISRPSFYFYFSSKDEVLLALLDQVIDEVQQRVAALPRDFAADPVGTWRECIAAFIEVFGAHRPVSAAAITARPRSTEVHELWSSSMRSWADYTTGIIRAEQARGAAPAGDAAELATALNLMNERVLSAAFAAEPSAVPQERLLEVLSSIWTRSIYGRDLAPNHPTD